MDIEKLKYLFNNIENDIGLLIDCVLTDPTVSPRHSAITASNLIKCYMQIMNELGEDLPYGSVEEFFSFNAYTNEEYIAFEERRKIESQDYKGVQY